MSYPDTAADGLKQSNEYHRAISEKLDAEAKTTERGDVGVRSRHCLVGRATAATPPPRPAAPHLHRTDAAAGMEPLQRRACPTPTATHLISRQARSSSQASPPEYLTGVAGGGSSQSSQGFLIRGVGD